MLTPSRTLLLTLLLLVPAFACSMRRPLGPAMGSSRQPSDNAVTGTVFSGSELSEHRGTLLEFLYPRVSGMVVDYATQPCPSVELRGRRSMFGSNDPIVYVDGARTANSCVLEDLSTTNISRVEIYPMGVSNRPGYETHPNGLILVFVRDGPASDALERSS